jgi:hypothetical protein
MGLPRRPTEPEVSLDGVRKCVALVRRRRVHDYSRRLVDDEEVPVFIPDREVGESARWSADVTVWWPIRCPNGD